MKKITLLLLCLTSLMTYAQDKQMWAYSFLNKEAPEFIAEKWLTDKPDTEGKYVLLEFWATWCGVCVKEIPKMNEFHNEFKDRMVVIGISDESEAKIKSLTNPKIEYYSSIDVDKSIFKAYGAIGRPHCVLINPAGVVIWEGFPEQEGYNLTSTVIKSLIKRHDRLMKTSQSN